MFSTFVTVGSAPLRVTLDTAGASGLGTAEAVLLSPAAGKALARTGAMEVYVSGSKAILLPPASVTPSSRSATWVTDWKGLF